MKKLIPFILCIMLSVCPAVAEEHPTDRAQPSVIQRVSDFEIEGMKEEVSESLFVSDDRYEIWYPSEYLEPFEKYGHDCFRPIGAGEDSEIYFMIVRNDADPENAEALLNEATGGFAPESEISIPRWSETADGSLLGSVDAKTENQIFRFYIAANKEDMLLITAAFPFEAAEGFGVRFDRMAATIAFREIQLNGRYEGDGFAISYPDQLLTPGQIYSHDAFVPIEESGKEGVYFLITQSDIAPENADALLDEAGAGYQGVYAEERREEILISDGLRLSSAYLEQGGDYNLFYLIKGKDTVYCITATYNVSHEFDYSVYFDAMAESFELLESE